MSRLRNGADKLSWWKKARKAYIFRELILNEIFSSGSHRYFFFPKFSFVYDASLFIYHHLFMTHLYYGFSFFFGSVPFPDSHIQIPRFLIFFQNALLHVNRSMNRPKIFSENLNLMNSSAVIHSLQVYQLLTMALSWNSCIRN